MADGYSVEYEMTDGLAAKYARAMLADRWFFSRFARVLGLPLYLLVMLLFAPVLPALAQRVPAGPLLALLACVSLVLWALFCVVMYRQARETILLPFHGRTERTVRVHFRPDGITLAALGADADRTWEDIDAVRAYRSLWLFRFRLGGYFVVPDCEVSPALEALIRDKARELDIDVRG
jgi:hypothetical protein